jgi:nucleolar complex protein 2
MGRKATKSTKKFAASGRLKKTIEARHKSKQFKKKSQTRKGQGDVKGKDRPLVEDEEEAIQKASSRYAELTLRNNYIENFHYSTKRMTVDSFLAGNFMEESGEEDIADVSSPP